MAPSDSKRFKTRRHTHRFVTPHAAIPTASFRDTVRIRPSARHSLHNQRKTVQVCSPRRLGGQIRSGTFFTFHSIQPTSKHAQRLRTAPDCPVRAHSRVLLSRFACVPGHDVNFIHSRVQAFGGVHFSPPTSKYGCWQDASTRDTRAALQTRGFCV